MAYESYDPRKAIREAIGIAHYDVKQHEDVYTIKVRDKRNKWIKIPMYIGEDIDDNPPEQPYMEILLVNTDYAPHNPSATIREMRAYFQFNLYFTSTDNIVPSTFMKNVKDQLQNVTRTNQESVSGTWYFSITKERHFHNDQGKSVEHMLVIEAYAIYTDRC